MGAGGAADLRRLLKGAGPTARRVRFVAVGAAALLLASGRPEAPAATAATGRSPRPASAVLTQSGTIEGTVRLAPGTDADATLVENTTDPEVCGTEHSLEDVVVSPARGVRYAIAALVDVPASAAPALRPVPAVTLDNHGCRFEPHAAVAAVGDTIVTLNSDPIAHTTHYYGAFGSNVALPAAGMRVARIARRAGLVTVLCDVHGWMKAYIRVDEHRWHAVTDDRGAFVIHDVPPGSFTLEIWHERLGTVRQTVDVTSGATTHVDVELSGAAPSSGSTGERRR